MRDLEISYPISIVSAHYIMLLIQNRQIYDQKNTVIV